MNGIVVRKVDNYTKKTNPIARSGDLFFIFYFLFLHQHDENG